MNFNFHSFFDQLLITSFTCLIVKHNMINMIEFVEIHDLQFRNLLLNPVKKFQNRIKFEQDKTSSTYIAFRTCVVSVTTYKKKKIVCTTNFQDQHNHFLEISFSTYNKRVQSIYIYLGSKYLAWVAFFFEIQGGIFYGRFNRAWPSRPYLKKSQNGIF